MNKGSLLISLFSDGNGTLQSGVEYCARRMVQAPVSFNQFKAERKIRRFGKPGLTQFE